MKRLKVALVFMLCFALLWETPFAFASPTSKESVEQFFDQQFKEKMEEYRIPGATLSLVAGDELVLAKGYGYAQLEEEIPVDPEKSLFRIGSTSKLFTWTAVMQLVEQGKLDLDTDIQEYLDFEIPAKLEGSKTEPAPITLIHLLTHTAGFEDYSQPLFRIYEADSLQLEEYIKTYLPKRIFPPGELIAYSNYGTALAGYIVQLVSGMPFAEYVEKHIYEPLRMENSTFEQPLPLELSEQMTQAYRSVEGDFKKGDFEFMPDAAGGMSSSAVDMAKFMLAHLRGGQGENGRILNEETAELMHRTLYRQHPDLHGMAHGFMEGTFSGQRVLFHSGSTMMFDTGMYLLPEQNVGLFISYSGGNYLMHKEIFEAFLDEYYPFTSSEPNVSPSEGMKERSKQYVGEYHQNRKSWTTDEKFISLLSGAVQVQVDDEGYLLVSHFGDKYRFIEVEPAVYERVDLHERAKDPFGNFNKIIFGEDPLGNTVLMADGPMTYSKAPWYGTLSITFLALIASILLVVGSFLYRLILSIVRRVRRRPAVEQPKLARTARWTAMIYGVLTLLFLLGFMSGGEFDPVYNFTKDTFGDVPAWTSVLEIFPLLMIVIGAALLVFTVAAWWKKYWTVLSRIHYSLYTLATMILSWLFIYWNLL